MPPAKSRPDDSRSEASSDKVGSNSAPALSGKNRRVTANAAAGSSLRDVVTAGTAGAAAASNPDGHPGLQWTSFDPAILHAYRHSYRLNTPAAFKSRYNQIVLANSSMGRVSPTMARRREQRRQGQDQLANAVRKHFNSMGITENEVVVDFLYKVRWQDKNFRMRFTPPKPR
ncbi:histone deacetylase complex subunit sap30 [Phlyctema vagabunda]|uniref:Histone deacetylase complex subunit sap30 n=1 Tax=Phlyctema vagabunda TaxID=108571 RepID=A0ABR4PN07_9HELO